MAGKDSSTLPIPVDFIDLTQDSPINLSRRDNENASGLSEVTRFNPSIHSYRNRIVHICDLVTEENLSNESTVQVLGDIINLDDSRQNGLSCSSATLNPIKQKVFAPSCPICLEELSSALKPMSTRCGHIYCSNCLQATLKAKKKCPKCQNSISEKTCIRLYF